MMRACQEARIREEAAQAILMFVSIWSPEDTTSSRCSEWIMKWDVQMIT